MGSSFVCGLLFPEAKLSDLQVVESSHHGKRSSGWEEPGRALGRWASAEKGARLSPPDQGVQVRTLSWAEHPPALFLVVLAQQHLWKWCCKYSELDFFPLWHLLFNGILIFLPFFQEAAGVVPHASVTDWVTWHQLYNTRLVYAQNLLGNSVLNQNCIALKNVIEVNQYLSFLGKLFFHSETITFLLKLFFFI